MGPRDRIRFVRDSENGILHGARRPLFPSRKDSSGVLCLRLYRPKRRPLCSLRRLFAYMDIFSSVPQSFAMLVCNVRITYTASTQSDAASGYKGPPKVDKQTAMRHATTSVGPWSMTGAIMRLRHDASCWRATRELWIGDFHAA